MKLHKMIRRIFTSCYLLFLFVYGTVQLNKMALYLSMETDNSNSLYFTLPYSLTLDERQLLQHTIRLTDRHLQCLFRYFHFFLLINTKTIKTFQISEPCSVYMMYLFKVFRRNYSCGIYSSVLLHQKKWSTGFVYF